MASEAAPAGALTVFAIFSTQTAALAALAILQKVAASLVFACIAAVGASAVSLAYGVIAGLPWRAVTPVGSPESAMTSPGAASF